MVSLPPQPAVGQKRNLSLENQMKVIEGAINALESPITRTVYVSGTLNTNDGLVLVDASAGDVILSLPLSALCSLLIRVKRIDGTGNTVKVVAIGPDLIDRAGGTLIMLQYEHYAFWPDQKQGWWLV